MTDISSVEMIKYPRFWRLKISFINEIAKCDRVGADVTCTAKGS